MEVTFQKRFADRYSQSREHQILDYLNQRGAAVPQVILSHTEQSYLEMTHAGQSLAQWLDEPGRARAQVWEVLAQAATVLVQVSRLEVWHLDIALRNFVVGAANAQGVPQVRLIDFGNAVSALFPLQKPLWMSPDASQHSLLRQALTQDWADFYRRHGLPPPADWQQAFDVPEALYRQDWTRQLQVEGLTARPCVLAHGLGQMMLSARDLVPWPPTAGQDRLAGLLELHDDAQAIAAVEGLIAQLHAWAQAHRPTPRPTAATPAPEPIQSQKDAPLAISPATGNQVARSRFPATVASVDAGAQTFGGAQAAQASDPRPEPDAPVAEPVPEAQPAPVAPVRKSRTWLPAVSGAAIVATGWVLLDMIYTAAASSKTAASVQLTVLGLSGVGFAVLVTAICLAGFLFGQARLAWWRRGIYANALGQGVLVMELWVQQMPAQVLWFAAACPLIALVSAFVGSMGGKSPPT